MILYMTWFSEQGRQLAVQVSKLPLFIDYGQIHSRYGGQMVIGSGVWSEKNGSHAITCAGQENEYSDGNVCVRMRNDRPLQEWLQEAFEEQFPVLIIGALGIVVRSIAPFIKHKTSDSPVLVMDEAGQFVIPVLAGHLGGANELAQQIAAGLQFPCYETGNHRPVAVVTTATDVHGVFAVDVFARRNGLKVCQPKRIRMVSGKILRGDSVTLAIDPDVVDVEALKSQQIPEQIELISWNSFLESGKADIVITKKQTETREESAGLKPLVLCPKMTILGMGCRKNKSYNEIKQMVQMAEKEGLIDPEDVFALASVDRKAGEAGLQELAQHLRVPFVVFSAEELNGVPGSFSFSGFVTQTVGVDNVCERAAVAAADGGALSVKKQMGNGVTLAASKRGKIFIDFSSNFVEK